VSEGYRAVGWNRFKIQYDAWMLAGMLMFLAAFTVATILTSAAGEIPTPLQLLIRASGALAFAMLSLVLCVGPLSRLSPRWLPVLYNRRHLGVATFVMALLHAVLVLIWYHGFGVLDPLTSLLVSNPRYDAIAGFPFESLGALALVILFLMAATSHDFWNATLGPSVWKLIHLPVYVAWALLVAHVALGVLQFEKHPAYSGALIVAAFIVCTLQLISPLLRRVSRVRLLADGWIDGGNALEIDDRCARILAPPGRERIAVFRNGTRVYAVSNVCRHQGGPLGEGRIVDGCITCPWHGFQYDPLNGRSPPPFTERIATYSTRLVGEQVLVNPQPHPPGTAIEPSDLDVRRPPRRARPDGAVDETDGESSDDRPPDPGILR
jgi:sulfoxide reductase heme-binding subunit YedZ